MGVAMIRSHIIFGNKNSIFFTQNMSVYVDAQVMK